MPCYHRTFTVSYTYTGAAITGVSLTTPCASTHSINMNGRVVMLVSMQLCTCAMCIHNKTERTGHDTLESHGLHG
jgi:hypothetical protein